MPRLPQVGGDIGNWGDILNDYLSQSLSSDGTIKDNAVTASAIADNAVNASSIEDGSITEAQLDAPLQAKVNSVSPVTSVAGRTGSITLTKSDVGLSNVANIDATARANHTGTQAASTISDFDSAADARISAQKGLPDGLATLDSGGHVPMTQLPSAVGNVVESANYASLPITGESSKIYITLDNNKVYRWGGSSYVEIAAVPSITDTDDIAEGSSNLYFTNERAQDAVGAILSDSSTVDLNYNDAANTISATVLPAGLDKNSLGGSQLSIANGGTGAANASDARTNLGLALGTDVQAYNPNTTVMGNAFTGTGAFVLDSSPTIQTPTIASFVNANHNHSNSAAGGQISLTNAVTGVLPVANGGTGSSTQNFVDLTNSQTVAGSKTFTSTTVMNVLGNNTALDVSTANTSTRAISINNTGAQTSLDALIRAKQSNAATTVPVMELESDANGGVLLLDNNGTGSTLIVDNNTGQTGIEVRTPANSASDTQKITVVGRAAFGYNGVGAYMSDNGTNKPAYITSNNKTWTFNTDGNMAMPGMISQPQTSAPTVATGYSVQWTANASGTKDGVAYEQGDVLITSNVGGTSKTKLIFDWSAA